MVQCESSTLLTEIIEIASLSLYFDPSLLAMCWRGVGKVSYSSMGSLGSGVALSAVLPDIIRQLCLAIATVTEQSAVEGDPLLEKRLKSGRLLCSLILRLESQFPTSFEDCSREVMDMLLSTQQVIHATENAALRFKLESSLLLLVSERADSSCVCLSVSSHLSVRLVRLSVRLTLSLCPLQHEPLIQSMSSSSKFIHLLVEGSSKLQWQQ